MEACRVRKIERVVSNHVCERAELSSAIERANRLLLFRRFEDCLELCASNVAVAKNYVEDDR